MTSTQTKLSQKFPQVSFEFDFPLASKTYFKIGGNAEVYLEVSDKQLLEQLVTFCFQENIKLTILGGASNVIVADEGVKGLVIKLHNQTITADKATGKVTAGAGVKMPDLVSKTTDAGLTGLEYFHGVPGTLGGAVYNNAHYLEKLIAEHINRVEVIDPEGQNYWLAAADCDFAYDHSRFQTSHEIIFNVEFKLNQSNKEQSQELIKEAIEYRAKTQPLNLPSSGCIFQNVKNNEHLKLLFPQFADKAFVPGGFLIDQAGLKGKKVGDIEVSQKHAAFFVNLGQGSAADVKKLITIVKATVKEKFAINLQEEVFFI